MPLTRKDVSELEILRAVAKYRQNPLKNDTPDISLSSKYPVKLIMAKMGQLDRGGYIECGVTQRTAWLTEKGKSRLKQLENANSKG